MELQGELLGNSDWVLSAKLIVGRDIVYSPEVMGDIRRLKRVGEPHSRIMHFNSLFLKNKHCFVPRTDWRIVHKFASMPSSEAAN